MKKQNTEIETNNLLVGSFAALPRKILKVIKKKKSLENTFPFLSFLLSDAMLLTSKTVLCRPEFQVYVSVHLELANRSAQVWTTGGALVTFAAARVARLSHWQPLQFTSRLGTAAKCQQFRVKMCKNHWDKTVFVLSL